MSVIILGEYLGNKKVKLVHEQSGSSITTDAPLDNNGEGRLFSPTDLLGAALGSCMLTVMGIVAERHNLDLSGMRMRVEKEMSQNPRRIGWLKADVYLPAHLTLAEREGLEKVAKTCPVKPSLHPDIKVEINFHYE